MLNISSLKRYTQSRRCRHLQKALWLLVLAGNLNALKSESIQVCMGEEERLSCNHNEIIMMTSAEYGRMSVGRCIPEVDDFMGCRNDVLHLVDSWCSGRRECNIKVPNPDLERENTECLKMLRLYLHATYTCLKVDANCRSDTSNIRATAEGIISSHVTDTKGCGTSRSPWIISAQPGQTIQLTLRDFSANKQSGSSWIGCAIVYGFIEEKTLAINHTICGGGERQRALYTSNTNQLKIIILARSDRQSGQFLITYKVSGCPELSRPAHAWYKREGNSAVIGCETTNQEWRLTCDGTKWIGEVGNCSVKVVDILPEAPKYEGIHFSSTVIMTAVASSALVLTVVAIVIGVVYIKKYRIRQETKFLTKTYSTIERNVQAYYRPIVVDQSANSDQMTSLPEHCTCATLQLREHENLMMTSSLERQSLYSSIKST